MRRERRGWRGVELGSMHRMLGRRRGGIHVGSEAGQLMGGRRRVRHYRRCLGGSVEAREDGLCSEGYR